MYEDLIESIRAKAREGEREVKPESEQAVKSVEEQLGFSLDPLLREIVLKVGCAVGPAYGILSLDEDADEEDSLVKNYRGFLDCPTTPPWPKQLVPFLNWGCAKYSLVDRESRMVYTADQLTIWSEGFDIVEFFELWVSDGDLWKNAEVKIIVNEGKNPFSGEPMEFRSEKRIGKDAFLILTYSED